MTAYCGADDHTNTELFLVDSGVESLNDVYLNIPKLKSLNLHSNYITRMENLSCLQQLTTLDLSSNQISRIEGLKQLTCLKHLNLSCNLLTIVEGLTNLCNLQSINLSYNQIVNLGGMRRLHPSNCVSTLQLQGNMLADMNHVITCLRGCTHLTCLVLHDGASATNPVCTHLNYAKVLREQIPSLRSTEKPAPDADVSELSFDQQLTIADSKSTAVSTPRIDAVLDRFHQALDNGEINSRERETTAVAGNDNTPVSSSETQIHLQHDEEKVELEQQLQVLEKQLLKRKIESTQLELQHLVKSTSPKKEPPPTLLSQEETESSSPKDDSGRRPLKNINNKASRTQRAKSRTQTVKTRTSDSPQSVSNNRTDVMYREAVSSTYQQLIKDLDTERTRRTKAEEAASKLAQHLKDVETKSNEHQMSQRNCDDMIRKLKRELTESLEAQDQAREIIFRTEARCKELDIEVRKSKKTCASQEQTITKLEKVIEKLERLKSETDDKHREENAQIDKSLSDQAELLRASQTTSRQQRAELADMKSLLAAREADHRREIEHRYTLDSPKLEELFQSKITSLVREHAAERNEYECRLSQSARDYNDLEDEFRMALQIEADRFQTLKTAFESLSGNQSDQEKILLSCKEKDTKSTKMISELTQLVKEQKDKIISLSKERQEVSGKLQGTKTKLEQQIEGLQGKVKDQDRLKKDNLELKNQVQGQHSIISGLRKERELWSKELAQQGASLANERGMLECKVDTLSQENKSLRANLDTEVDTVKIKTKLVSDLTDTVSTLKQRVGHLESEVKEKDRQLQTITTDHDKELDDERNHTAQLEQQLEDLIKRKEQLKEQLRCTEDELAGVKESHKNLKSKWADKSSSISALEEQVKQMRDGWYEKEKRLQEERDKAIEAADLALQRMKTADDGFRKQLETKEKSHADKLRDMCNQYELRIAEEQHRVEQVESEMRELLIEKENSKKQFDSRLKKLSQAFADLQYDSNG